MLKVKQLVRGEHYALYIDETVKYIGRTKENFCDRHKGFLFEYIGGLYTSAEESFPESREIKFTLRDVRNYITLPNRFTIKK